MIQKQKPRTLVCFICGRQFGTTSLSIHLKSCEKKFYLEQQKKPSPLRIKLPQIPEELSMIFEGNCSKQFIEQYNQKAIKMHKYQILPACKFCGRTFNEDSLKLHQKVCKKQGDNYKKQIQEFQKTELDFKKPRVLVCCVCGKQFGLTSLKIHYPQCIEKHSLNQNKLPKQLRKETPKFSENQLELINNKENWSFQEIQLFNSTASGNFRSNGMVKCQNCLRTFLQQSYEKHKKNCILINGDKGNIKKRTQPNENMSNSKQKEILKPRVLMCHICGREFGLTSLQIHQKRCQIKFVNQQLKKQKKERKAVPEFPSEQMNKYNFESVQQWKNQQIQSYNSIANHTYRQESLSQCYICKRKFFEEALLKHLKYCEKNLENQQKREKERLRTQSSDLKRSLKKNTLSKKQLIENSLLKEEISVDSKQIIPQVEAQFQETMKHQICNDMNTSMETKQIKQSRVLSPVQEVHQKQISSEFKQSDQDQRLKNQIDVEPFAKQNNAEEKVSQNKQITSQKIQLYLEKDQQNLKENAEELQILETKECKGCKRKFNLDRIAKHQSICKKYKEIIPEKINQKIIQGSKKPFQKFIMPEIIQNYSKMLIPCKKCGRKFIETRIEQHENCCKGEICQRQMKNDKILINCQQNNVQKKKETKLNLNQIDIFGENQCIEIDLSEKQECQKCGRNFLKERIQVHQRVCKQIKKNNKKQNLVQKNSKKDFGSLNKKESLELEAVRKTKDNFFNLVKDLKKKKINESDIDQELNNELAKIEESKSPFTGRKQKKYEEKQFKLIDNQNCHSNSNGFEVSKWKANKNEGKQKIGIGKVSKQKGFRETFFPQI